VHATSIVQDAGHKLNLTFDELDNIVTQGKELGVYFYMMTGGEPLVRKADIIRLCEKHNDCAFHCYTNGTLVDEKLCEDMKRVGNLSLSISLEGRCQRFPTWRRCIQ
jgi:MoaA/NifB/PqqE/SkfB family radical SAM enzyme